MRVSLKLALSGLSRDTTCGGKMIATMIILSLFLCQYCPHPSGSYNCHRRRWYFAEFLLYSFSLINSLSHFTFHFPYRYVFYFLSIIKFIRHHNQSALHTIHFYFTLHAILCKTHNCSWHPGSREFNCVKIKILFTRPIFAHILLFYNFRTYYFEETRLNGVYNFIFIKW